MDTIYVAIQNDAITTSDFISFANLVIVVLSAIFVILQIYKTQKAVKANTYQGLIAQEAAIDNMFFKNKDLRELSQEFDCFGIKDQSNYKEWWAIFMMLGFFENLCYQKKLGSIPNYEFEHWKTYLAEFGKSNKVRDVWASIDHNIFFPIFRAYMDEVTRN